MRVAFTTSGTTLEAQLDPRFGRAPSFLVYDTENGGLESVDNRQNLSGAQGAGIQAAATVARTGAESVVTGHCGPKAFSVLSKAGIQVFLTDAPTVADALKRLQSGALTPAASADVEGHWA